MISDVTRKITGVDNSRDASDEIRDVLLEKSFNENSTIKSKRYSECASCEYLKEELKVFGKTVKDKTPVCGKCGCSLLLKVPLGYETCPLKKW
jgi:predicted SprT family Zn-dependent metalloprotease